jgi:signal peptidase II
MTQKREPLHKNILVILFAGFLLFIFEYFIKNFVIIGLAEKALKLNGFLSIQFVPNQDMAFSIPINQTVTIALAGLILLGFIQYFTICVRDGLYMNIWAANFIIWGAFSNLYDRISRGFVVDYLTVGHLPIFNLADVAIIIGLISLVFLAKNHEKNVVLGFKEA